MMQFELIENSIQSFLIASYKYALLLPYIARQALTIFG